MRIYVGYDEEGLIYSVGVTSGRARRTVLRARLGYRVTQVHMPGAIDGEDVARLREIKATFRMGQSGEPASLVPGWGHARTHRLTRALPSASVPYARLYRPACFDLERGRRCSFVT
jgi:hypothetical protein